MTTEQSKSLAETNQWSHVDKTQTHLDWDALYREITPLIGVEAPTSENVQRLIQRHHTIISRFYPPTAKAYIGMSLYYRENPEMEKFHNTYHPEMVDFLSQAMFALVQEKL